MFLKLTCPDKCIQALYKDTLAALQELLKSVLAKDPTPDGLQSVFKVVWCFRHICSSSINIVLATQNICFHALVPHPFLKT